MVGGGEACKTRCRVIFHPWLLQGRLVPPHSPAVSGAFFSASSIFYRGMCTNWAGPNFTFHLLIFFGFIQDQAELFVRDCVIRQGLGNVVWNGVQFAFRQDAYLVVFFTLCLQPPAGKPTAYTLANAQPSAATSRHRAMGAAIMVDKSPTPPAPKPMHILVASRTVSTPSRAFIPRLYFLCRAARTSFSDSSCFWSSLIFWRRKLTPSISSG